MSNELEKEFEASALTLYEQVLQVKVIDQASFEQAGTFGKSLNDLKKKIEDYFKPLKDAAHKAHKAVTARESEELKPVNEAIVALRTTVNGYLAEQARKDREEQERLQKESQEKADRERENLLKAAVKADEKGKGEKAEALLEKAENVYVAPVIVAPTVQTKTENTSAAMDTEVVVVDLKAFITELVKRNMAPTMLDVKTAAMKNFVTANALEFFPGLSIKKVPKVRFR